MFVLVMLIILIFSVPMIQSGHTLLADCFVAVCICIAAEILRPEESTLKAISWAKSNLKWICLPIGFIIVL